MGEIGSSCFGAVMCLQYYFSEQGDWVYKLINLDPVGQQICSAPSAQLFPDNKYSWHRIMINKCFKVSVHFSWSVVSDSLRPHESQHARPPCPSQTTGVHSDSSPSSQWCHPAISSSAISNPSQHQSLFQWVSSSHEVAKVLEFQLQHHSLWRNPRADRLQNGLVGSPCSPRDSQESSQHHSSKASILQCSAFFTVQLSHPYMTTGKTIALTRRTFVGKIMSLLLNMLSRLVITFLPRSKRFLISWLQSRSAVILEPPKNKFWHCFHCFPIYFPWNDGTRCHDLRFVNVELYANFFTFLFHFHQEAF